MKKAQRRLYFLRQRSKFNRPQELLIQFYSAIIESVLCTSITVWFSSDTKYDHKRLRRVVRTAERIIGTTLPTLQELYLSRVKGLSKSLEPLTSSTLSLWTDPVWSTLQSSEHQNDQTQKQFLPSGNPSHEHVTKRGTHNTIINYYLNTHTYFIISNLPMSDLTHNCLYYILCFCYFVYLYIVLLLSVSCCCHSVALWSFSHYNKFLVCVNTPGQ